MRELKLVVPVLLAICAAAALAWYGAGAVREQKDAATARDTVYVTAFKLCQTDEHCSYSVQDIVRYHDALVRLPSGD